MNAARKHSPPQINSNVIVNHTYRFRSTTDAATAITFNQVLAMVGSVATAANATLTSIARSLRLNSIEIWAATTAANTQTTCSVLWTSTIDDNAVTSKEISDTSVSASWPAHVLGRPPAGTECSFWTIGSTAPMFTIVAPTGSVVDVNVTYVLGDLTSGVATTVASATLGTMYYPPLDGATDLYLPVSLGTTT